MRGVCSMARTVDPNSANSQFFICFDDATFLDGQYTVWGEVVERAWRTSTPCPPVASRRAQTRQDHRPGHGRGLTSDRFPLTAVILGLTEDPAALPYPVACVSGPGRFPRVTGLG